MHDAPSQPQTPRRPALLNELGQRQTPPSGPETFQAIGRGPQILFIGLGPDAAVPVSLVGRLAGERLPALALLGAAMVVLGVVASELRPHLRRRGGRQPA